MAAISYISPTGQPVDLLSTHYGLSVEYGGLTGMVGESVPEVITTPGVRGQMVDYHTIKPMVGTLKLIISAADCTGLQDTYRFLRSVFSPTACGTLMLDAGHGLGVVTARVRLNSPIALPPSDLGETTALADVEVSLICDDGVWQQSQSETNPKVSITNFGDVMICPRIHWTESTHITLPSRAEFVLPAVKAEHVLVLDPLRGCAISSQGKPVPELLSTIKVLPEGVPVGETRSFVLTQGAYMSWDVEWLDPWM